MHPDTTDVLQNMFFHYPSAREVYDCDWIILYWLKSFIKHYKMPPLDLFILKYVICKLSMWCNNFHYKEIVINNHVIQINVVVTLTLISI